MSKKKIVIINSHISDEIVTKKYKDIINIINNYEKKIDSVIEEKSRISHDRIK